MRKERQLQLLSRKWAKHPAVCEAICNAGRGWRHSRRTRLNIV
jgi:hypothetical protein